MTGKKIVPYTLDDTPLPDALSSFIYIPADDREHGHPGLLQAVFVKAFRPSVTSLLPGKGRMEADAMGDGVRAVGVRVETERAAIEDGGAIPRLRTSRRDAGFDHLHAYSTGVHGYRTTRAYTPDERNVVVRRPCTDAHDRCRDLVSWSSDARDRSDRCNGAREGRTRRP